MYRSWPVRTGSVTPDALRALITSSGLSASEWARTVAGRDPRTVRRWLAGDAIPESVADWLARLGTVRVTAQDVVVTIAR